MKRFFHALAALWPKKRDLGSPPVSETHSGLRQHLAAIRRMERHLSECRDTRLTRSREGDTVMSHTRPARREVERSGSPNPRTECDHVGHPSSKSGSQTVGITERNAVTSRQVKRSGSTTQPQSLPRIPQPMPLLTILMLVFFMCLMAAKQVSAQAEPAEAAELQQSSVSGVVVDTAGVPIEGATVSAIGTSKYTKTNSDGRFALQGLQGNGLLKIRFVGYETAEFRLSSDLNEPLQIVMFPYENVIEEVEVSTGYQTIPRERATGSFVHIDNELLNRRVTTTILERLDGVAPGLQFDNRSGSENMDIRNINIRGINTLTSGFRGPLVVVDNFPYEGDLANINPNDVESITLLKDAAATSIWGARAGNGVIVINLKKSGAQEPFKLSVIANRSVVEKPNIYYYKVMDASDFIDVEMMLFEKGHYDPYLNSQNVHRYVFSPVVTLLDNQRREEPLPADQLKGQINAYRTKDYRDEMYNYFYRQAVNQQYQISMQGGSNRLSYILSAGYDDNAKWAKGFNNQRFTLRSSNTFRPTSNLEVMVNVMYAQNKTANEGAVSYPISPSGGKRHLYPYAQLVGDDGSALAVPRIYHINYVDTAGQGKLLDWKYRPMDELGASDNRDRVEDLNAAVTVGYNMLEGLKAELQYAFGKQNSDSYAYRSIDAFSTRDLINRFTQIVGGVASNPLPLGGILQNDNAVMVSHKVRGQINFNRTLFGRHEVSILAGSELSSRNRDSYGFQTYGYDPAVLTHVNVDYTKAYPIYNRLSSNSFIPSYGGFSGAMRRFVSFYGNASYIYNTKYIASFSARKDASNLFGVKTNDRWNPLWSAGLSWLASNELFINAVDWIDLLKFRGSYGHSGNAGGGSGTRPIIYYRPNALYTNLPYANISEPPNPHLKWENVQMINYGIDFSILKRRLSGSLEYFTKKSSDLIAVDPIDPTTGFFSARRNVAEIRSRGFDFQLNSRNQLGSIVWDAAASMSHVKDVVAKFNGTISATTHYVTGTGRVLTPLVDKVLYPVFSYQFLGLDPQNGDPIGLLGGEPSKDYTKILNDSLHHINYHGSALPLFYGFFRNSFAYKGVGLTFNLSYKFGYYFQKETILYGSLFDAWTTHDDYYKRWQEPGDEASTTVPSMTYPAAGNRDSFYMNSSANIEKGDHIRLQDISISYLFKPKFNFLSNSFNINVFLSSNNVALLWTASKSGLDPDYTELPPPRNYSLGIRANF